jgi:hypothetical protein
MNKLLLTVVLALVIVSTGWSQGTVNFANSVTFTTLADRLVRGPNGTPLVGSDLSQPATYVAQLYYGENVGSLQAHTASPARFRPGTSGPGLWLGGTRTLTGFAPGTTLTLEVRAWDMRTGATWDVAGIGGRGRSGTFTYTIPFDPLSPPAAYFMEGFRAFTVGVPEPAPLLLLGAAVPALWLVMRRRIAR